MADENESSQLSEESLGFLEDAKKGKPRRFAMLCKGTTVVSLVLYKKGSLEKYKKEAKSQGKGQFYFGVTGGGGLEIVFQLARSDGFEAPPVKDTILKKYLEESGFKCKPAFAIVESLPVIPDDETSTTTDLTAWKSKRALVIENLRQLAKVIADLKDPDSVAAIIEIKAVIANLPESPTTASQVADIVRYLDQDEVVLDVCDMAFDFREDLKQTLPQL